MAAACTPAPAPAPPPVLPPVPVVQRPRPAPDWFQRQLAAAAVARHAHQPPGDKAGAQLAYDNVVRAACQRVAIEGPDRYKPRCDAFLKPAPVSTPTPPPADPFACMADGDDDAMRACND